MIESSIMATNVDAKNRFAKASFDVDGGCLIALTAPTAQGDEVFTATKPATGGLGDLWVAYNPSEHITGGFTELQADPRELTNVAGRVFTAFKPEVGDIFVLGVDCVDSASQTATAGKFLEAKNGQTTWTKADSATTGSTAVEIKQVVTIPFPAAKGHIGMDKAKGFKVEVVQR